MASVMSAEDFKRKSTALERLRNKKNFEASGHITVNYESMEQHERKAKIEAEFGPKAM
jgi:hypothetical protein